MRKNSLALGNEAKSQYSKGTALEAGDPKIRCRSVWERFLKRFMDVSISSVILIIGFPFYIAIAAFIKITSRGSIFFTQERVGENGRTFVLYKFRTMKSDSDDTLHREFTKNFILGKTSQSTLDGSALSAYKIKNDPRVTAVGSFLRKTSLDELPQLINVLRGEMTVVGPRPPLLYEYECYDEWHKQRLTVKPGLTGLWQVSGRSSVPFHEMVMLDLYYIEQWSVLLDIKIIFKTVPVMLAGTGGY